MSSAVPEREADLRPDARVGELFADAVAIMARLRAPGGCPWDREQTFASIRKFTLEETYEVLDAIEREQWADLADELGDLLFQVVFHARMAEERGQFDFADVAQGIREKLVRRHPHVFGAAAGEDRASLGDAWEAQKAAERSRPESARHFGEIRIARPGERLAGVEGWRGRMGANETVVGDNEIAVACDATVRVPSAFSDQVV